MMPGMRRIMQLVVPPPALRTVDAVQRVRFALAGRRPWSAGYIAARNRVIARALDTDDLLRCFRSGEALPPGYGVGFDERCVEYPWLFSQLPDGPGALLDAGSVLNHAFVLAHPHLRARTLHILTLAPEDVCFWHRGISYLFGDLRDIPIREGFYDAVACVSTLEHVGYDNAHYTGRAGEGSDRDAFRIVMAELARVLKPGGTLLLTVPFGLRREYDRLQVFDAARLDDAIRAFGSARDVQTTFFRYSAEGWNVATRDASADAEFVDRFASRDRAAGDPFRIEPDRAVAARAVACVRMVRAGA